jgi:hypothetical protein
VQLTWNTLNDIVYPEDFASLELLSTYTTWRRRARR